MIRSDLFCLKHCGKSNVTAARVETHLSLVKGTLSFSQQPAAAQADIGSMSIKQEYLS